VNIQKLKDASDHELMEYLIQGHSSAFEELVQRYQKSITNFIFCLIHDSNRALDLSQETFIRVFKNAKRYTPKANFSTWIYTIASNLAKDDLKSKKWRNLASLDKPLQEEEGKVLGSSLEGKESSPFERLETQERALVVREILETIHEPYRSTLILRDFEDFSYEEIAQIQNCSLGTVKSRVNRGRLQFKEKYSNRYLEK
jgi:RNA polymerase sigma-70 factor (ECF subfamily)